MNKWYNAPAEARVDLLTAMAHDAYSVLPQDLAQAIRTSATHLAKLGRSNVWENGLPLDYQTLIGLAIRFADSSKVRESVRLERTERNRYNFMYRR